MTKQVQHAKQESRGFMRARCRLIGFTFAHADHRFAIEEMKWRVA